MSTESFDDAIASAGALARYLHTLGEERYARHFERVAGDLEAARTPAEIRDAVQNALAVFGGMNSVNDLVVMDGASADRSKNRRLDELRTAVYESLIDAV